MHLDVGGHPLHSRALAVTLVQRADGKLDTHASVVDLRKRGFVPVAGDLQGPGVIHNMRLDGVVDPATATLETIEAQQPNVAFEPSAVTGGESCRDPIARIEALAGTRLDAGYARRLGAEIGGPLGCSHILTLARLLGSTVAWALARDRERHGPRPRRAPGERVFRRALIVDGHESASGGLQLAVQLTDLHFAPAPAAAKPMDRFAGELEVRALAEISLWSFELARIAAAERRRGFTDLDDAPWLDRTDVVAPLVGVRMMSGVTGELLRRFGAAPDDRPLLDALLMLGPTVVQAAGALSESWPVLAKQHPSVIGIAGLPDSCYMWRRHGALFRTHKAEEAPPEG